jgi:hypothetical protein
MTYQVKMESPVIRGAKIQASVEVSIETRDFYDFRNQKTQLKLVRIASDLLVSGKLPHGDGQGTEGGRGRRRLFAPRHRPTNLRAAL